MATNDIPQDILNLIGDRTLSESQIVANINAAPRAVIYVLDAMRDLGEIDQSFPPAKPGARQEHHYRITSKPRTDG